MKFDLFSSIGVAIVGITIGFLVVNFLVPSLKDYSFKAIDTSANGKAADNGFNYADYDEPNNEVFNYDALNPTVEVYIGQCDEYDANGACRTTTTIESDVDNNEDDNEENDEEPELDENGEPIYNEEDEEENPDQENEENE